MVYHYTSIDAFVGMLGNDPQKNFLTFWASSVFAMNDPSEFSYGKELIKKLISEYENKLGIEDKYKLSNSFEELERHDPEYGKPEDIFERYFINPPKTPFVMSFSRNKDDLAMWNLYGNKGKGISLLFDDDISKNTTDAITTDEMMDVDYSGDIKSNKSLYTKFVDLFETGQEELKGAMEKDVFLMKKCWEFSRIIVLLAPFLKHKKYAKEKEVRLCGNLNKLEFMQYRTINGNIVPYVDVNIPLKYLKGIIIGPCCDAEITRRGLNSILYSHGLNKDIFIKKDIDISSSQIPYRIL